MSTHPKREVWSVRWDKRIKRWRVWQGRDWLYILRTKREALSEAIDHCRGERTQLRIFLKNGRIQSERTYPRSSDPRPKPGGKRNRG